MTVHGASSPAPVSLEPPSEEGGSWWDYITGPANRAFSGITASFAQNPELAAKRFVYCVVPDQFALEKLEDNLNGDSPEHYSDLLEAVDDLVNLAQQKWRYHSDLASEGERFDDYHDIFDKPVREFLTALGKRDDDVKRLAKVLILSQLLKVKEKSPTPLHSRELFAAAFEDLLETFLEPIDQIISGKAVSGKEGLEVAKRLIELLPIETRSLGIAKRINGWFGSYLDHLLAPYIQTIYDSVGALHDVAARTRKQNGYQVLKNTEEETLARSTAWAIGDALTNVGAGLDDVLDFPGRERVGLEASTVEFLNATVGVAAKKIIDRSRLLHDLYAVLLGALGGVHKSGANPVLGFVERVREFEEDVRRAATKEVSSTMDEISSALQGVLRALRKIEMAPESERGLQEVVSRRDEARKNLTEMDLPEPYASYWRRALREGCHVSSVQVFIERVEEYSGVRRKTLEELLKIQRLVDGGLLLGSDFTHRLRGVFAEIPTGREDLLKSVQKRLSAWDDPDLNKLLAIEAEARGLPGDDSKRLASQLVALLAGDIEEMKRVVNDCIENYRAQFGFTISTPDGLDTLEIALQEAEQFIENQEEIDAKEQKVAVPFVLDFPIRVGRIRERELEGSAQVLLGKLKLNFENDERFGALLQQIELDGDTIAALVEIKTRAIDDGSIQDRVSKLIEVCRQLGALKEQIRRFEDLKEGRKEAPVKEIYKQIQQFLKENPANDIHWMHRFMSHTMASHEAFTDRGALERLAQLSKTLYAAPHGPEVLDGFHDRTLAPFLRHDLPEGSPNRDRIERLILQLLRFQRSEDFVFFPFASQVASFLSDVRHGENHLLSREVSNGRRQIAALREGRSTQFADELETLIHENLVGLVGDGIRAIPDPFLNGILTGLLKLVNPLSYDKSALNLAVQGLKNALVEGIDVQNADDLEAAITSFSFELMSVHHTGDTRDFDVAVRKFYSALARVCDEEAEDALEAAVRGFATALISDGVDLEVASRDLTRALSIENQGCFKAVRGFAAVQVKAHQKSQLLIAGTAKDLMTIFAGKILEREENVAGVENKLASIIQRLINAFQTLSDRVCEFKGWTSYEKRNALRKIVLDHLDGKISRREAEALELEDLYKHSSFFFYGRDALEFYGLERDPNAQIDQLYYQWMVNLALKDCLSMSFDEMYQFFPFVIQRNYDPGCFFSIFLPKITHMLTPYLFEWGVHCRTQPEVGEKRFTEDQASRLEYAVTVLLQKVCTSEEQSAKLRARSGLSELEDFDALLGALYAVFGKHLFPLPHVSEVPDHGPVQSILTTALQRLSSRIVHDPQRKHVLFGTRMIPAVSHLAFSGVGDFLAGRFTPSPEALNEPAFAEALVGRLLNSFFGEEDLLQIEDKSVRDKVWGKIQSLAVEQVGQMLKKIETPRGRKQAVVALLGQVLSSVDGTSVNLKHTEEYTDKQLEEEIASLSFQILSAGIVKALPDFLKHPWLVMVLSPLIFVVRVIMKYLLDGVVTQVIQLLGNPQCQVLIRELIWRAVGVIDDQDSEYIVQSQSKEAALARTQLLSMLGVPAAEWVQAHLDPTVSLGPEMTPMTMIENLVGANRA